MPKLEEIENCLTCKNSMEGEINPATMQKSFICVLNPPIMQAIPMQQGIAKITGFPEVTEKMVCRQYDAKPMILSLVD